MLRAPVLVLFALGFTLAGCERQPEKLEVTVEDAWIRLPAAPGMPGAAYFTLRSNGVPAELQGISSPAVERIELHQSSETNGVIRMTPLTKASLAAGEPLEFRPGGSHAMLFGIRPGVKPGERLTLTFTFHPALRISTEAEVRPAGGSAHAAH